MPHLGLSKSQTPRVPFENVAIERKTILAFDGTPLAVQVLGSGKRPCILANGIATDYRAFRFIIEAFHERFRFYSWDHRGQFGSARPLANNIDIKDHASDLHAILRHESLHHPLAIGWSMGGQILVEATRSNHKLYRAVVLLSSLPGRLFDTAVLGPGAVTWIPRAIKLLRHFDGLAQKTLNRAVRQKRFQSLLTRVGLLHHDFAKSSYCDIFEHLETMDMETFLSTLLKLHEHNAYDLLAELRCPTLIFAPTHDLMTPLSAVEKIAAAIEDSKIVTLAGASHYSLLEMPHKIVNELNRFFDEHSIAS